MDPPLLTTLVRRWHLAIRRRIHDDLVAAGHARLSPAHMYIFQSPGPEGAGPSELARRTNITKQALNHLLAGLERDGYLRRVPAAGDRRATVIRLTDRGREVERLMNAGSLRLEQEWSQRFDGATIEHLRALLVELESLTG
ncbi:MAG TPA: MarR family transcriptional regulator [Acidimicrobiales bacterium]|jgi:DNA-binding MarR family transcriptional regulator